MSNFQIVCWVWTVIILIISTAAANNEGSPSSIPIFFGWLLGVFVFSAGFLIGQA